MENIKYEYRFIQLCLSVLDSYNGFHKRHKLKENTIKMLRERC